MAKLLNEQDIQARLSQLPGWTREGNRIAKTFVLKNFLAALQFVNRVGALAEGMDHHPDIFIHQYKRVTLTLSTHDAGGLTVMDFELAGRIEKIDDMASFL